MPAFVFTAVSISACGGGSGEGLDANGLPIENPSASVQPSASPSVSNSLSGIQDTVFSQSCALSGCHSGASPQAGLSLDSAATSFNNLVNVNSTQQDDLLRVSPNDPDASYIIRKLEGGPNISGGRMPAIGGPLSSEQTQNIRNWITLGALNDETPGTLQVRRTETTTQAERFGFTVNFNQAIDEVTASSSVRIYLVENDARTLADIDNRDVTVQANQLHVIYRGSLQNLSAIELELNHPALGVVVSALGQQLDGDKNNVDGGTYRYVYTF